MCHKDRFYKRLNEVLKRAALHNFPGAKVASLSGEKWTAFLDRGWDSTNAGQFGGGPLESAPYSEQFEGVDVENLLRSSLLWLRDHPSDLA